MSRHTKKDPAMTVSSMNRRRFLNRSLAVAGVGASFAIGGTKSSGKVIGANDTIRIAVAGLNGRGGAHVDEFGKLAGVEISHLIDPDSRTYQKRLDQIRQAGGREPVTAPDVRRVLEDRTVDAISIATPNHWHALMTIWACQAGKDVYVEKPCSHNVHEGRIAVQAARRYSRIVQHGTQGRSSRDWALAVAAIRSGKLGKLLVSRALCYKPRVSIGTKPVTPPPEQVAFDLWLGPAREQPYHANLVHYNWHWFWDFGNGDIGNQGVHQMDIARWLIPGPTAGDPDKSATFPKSILNLGGRFGYHDQGETPNTQLTVMDFGDALLIFEVRGLETKPFHRVKVGNIAHLESGMIVDGKFVPKGEDRPVPLSSVVKLDVDRGPGKGHFGNFIAAVRSRKTEDLNADILEGHYSAALCHLANASFRLGRQVPFDKAGQALSAAPDGSDALERMQEHLKDDGVALGSSPCTLGRLLTFDGAAESFVNDAEANRLLTRSYRTPFVVPDRIT